MRKSIFRTSLYSSAHVHLARGSNRWRFSLPTTRQDHLVRVSLWIRGGGTHQSGRGWYFSAVSGSSNTLTCVPLCPHWLARSRLVSRWKPRAALGVACEGAYLGRDSIGIIRSGSLEEETLLLLWNTQWGDAIDRECRGIRSQLFITVRVRPFRPEGPLSGENSSHGGYDRDDAVALASESKLSWE